MAGSFTESFSDSVQQPSLLMCLTPFTAFMAWICSLVANFTCDYITIDVTVNDLEYFLGFGFWNYQGWSFLIESGTIYYARTCYTYGGGVNPDSKWKTAQAFSIVAVVIGGLAMAFNCCIICTPNPSKGYQCFALLYLFTCLSQGLTFLFLQSEACLNNPIYSLEIPDGVQTGESCNLAWGANTSIAATCLWFLCACFMCCIGFKEQRGGAGDRAPENIQEMEEAEKEEPGAVNDPATE